jgi:hypothetical protein
MHMPLGKSNITSYQKKHCGNQTDYTTTVFMHMPLSESKCVTSGTQNTKVLSLDARNQLTNSSSNEMCPMATKARM